MTFDEYQAEAIKTSICPDVYIKDKDGNFILVPAIYPVLGLAGEASEVSEKFKKVMRDKGGNISGEDVDLITKELGDVIWYVSAICHYMGLSFDDVAKLNIEKLKSRRERGMISGSGDLR